MGNNHHIPLFLLFLHLTAAAPAGTAPAPSPIPATAAATAPTPSPIPTTAAATAPTPSPIPATAPTSTPKVTNATLPLPPPPPSAQDLQLHHQQQLDNIIDALIGAGDFYSWANVLSAVTDPSTLPISATLFIPADDSLSPTTTVITVDPFVFPYHIVPQRLSFADLRQFKPFSRLPTLLPAMSILITNNSVSNFTLDGSVLTHPDLYTTSGIAVHGISHLLDYSVYGDDDGKMKPSQTDAVPSPPRPPPPPGVTFLPAGDLIGNHSAGFDAACLCSTGVWTTVFLLVVVAALALKN